MHSDAALIVAANLLILSCVLNYSLAFHVTPRFSFLRFGLPPIHSPVLPATHSRMCVPYTRLCPFIICMCLRVRTYRRGRPLELRERARSAGRGGALSGRRGLLARRPQLARLRERKIFWMKERIERRRFFAKKREWRSGEIHERVTVVI